jgi:hypothetical protein
MIEITNNFPIPANTFPPGLHGREALYPFHKMERGDSFQVPAAMKARVSSAASKWKARHPGWSYCTVSADGMMRLWRTA